MSVHLYLAYVRMLQNPGNSTHSAVLKPCFWGSIIGFLKDCAMPEREWLPFRKSHIIRGVKKNKKEAAMNDTTAAYRLREQLKKSSARQKSASAGASDT